MELSLSEEQVARLKDVNETFFKDQRALRADTAMTREKMMAGRKQMMDKRNKAIKSILTEEQYTKWMAMRQEGSHRPEPGRHRQDMTAELKKEVGISDKQVEEIKAINAEMAKEFARLRADSTVTRPERPKAARAIVSSRNEKIQKLLTPEQYEKFLAYENERTQARRGSHPMRKREHRN